MRPERLHQDRRHRITLFRGSGDGRRAVVCFEHGRDRAMRGFEPPDCPRFARRLGIDALVVQTARRDWFVSDRSAALAEALERATRFYDEVVATGFSMGGYAALLYSAACHARRVMAVSPQYSIDPRVAPYDPGRHPKFAHIGMAMPRPEDRGARDVAGLLIYDPAIAADRAHAARIRTGFPRLTAVPLPHGGHPATGVLALAGRIGPLAEMLVENRIDAAAIRRDHRAVRVGAESYRLSLAIAALPRHPARALPELRRLARQGNPRTRLEAGMALLDHAEAEALALLGALLEEGAELPPGPLHRLRRRLVNRL
ncbi:hypothetical protein [Paracoccus binzhouensis]|uniref:hypothetical protein n=1 Tax=Paracoccus binzhouensis TaxID=2796149 RepID=UPI0018EECB3A|nr:hypothetical protein [Paracoccus binzhouensis]